jgi:hypothetical protein
MENELPKQGWHQRDVAEAIAALLAYQATDQETRRKVVSHYDKVG